MLRSKLLRCVGPTRAGYGGRSIAESDGGGWPGGLVGHNPLYDLQTLGCQMALWRFGTGHRNGVNFDQRDGTQVVIWSVTALSADTDVARRMVKGAE